MAHDDKIKISIQDKAGLYYYATKQADNSYVVASQVGLRHIKHLPKDWIEIPAIFDRNMTYMGVFRASSKTLMFSDDGRAILLDFMYGSGGVNAYATVTIYKYNEADFDYDVFFSTQVDFSQLNDDKQTGFLQAPLLQSGVNELIKSKSASNFNIPFWVKSGSVWVPNDATFVQHDGIKLLYNATLISGATPAVPKGFVIGGWDRGNHGALQGVHELPGMNQYTIVQNNGTTTYIGNDILNPILIQGTQRETNFEVNFTNSSRPYTSGNYCLKDLIISPDMQISMTGQFSSNITFGPGADYTLSFVIFEIDKTDEPPIISGEYQIFATVYSLLLPGPTGSYTPPLDPFTTTPVPVTLSPDKVYVFGIIYDGVPAGVNSGDLCAFNMSDLTVTFESQYNSGTAAPVNAPQFPESTIVAFNQYTMFEKLVQSMDSITTDPYGFPVIVGDYTAVSDYLTTAQDPADNYGLEAPLLMYTSENAVRAIKGIPYLTISLADYFTNCLRMDGLGLGVSGNTIRIEKLEYFFDAATEILALTDVASFKCEPMSDIMFNNIKAGYKEPSTNKDYGVDEWIVPSEYNLPLNKSPKTEDLAVTSAIVGPYEIEKMRAQRNTSQISAPSASSNCVILQLSPDMAPAAGVLAPDGTPVTVTPYYLQKYGLAQSTDPSAATYPYIAGLLFPESAYNVNLIPAKNLLRLSPYLSAICDQQETGYLSYRRIYQQNYADPLTPLTGPSIKTNIYGDVVDSVADISIGSFLPKLFRPYLFKITAPITGAAYDLINANPYGYISFTWKGVVFMGFISRVEQKAATGSATQLELIAHPATTDAQLKMT